MTDSLEIFNRRLRSRMLELGTNQTRLAKSIGLTQPAISNMLQGRTANPKTLHAIARKLDTTVEYLMGQTEDPAAGAFPPPSAEMVADKLDSVMIPEIDISYSMGGGSVIADHHSGEMRPFPREWLRPLIKGGFDQVFIARGEGDSMQPTLLDGDIVIVDTAQKSVDRQDRLWAICYGDLGMIKRVRKMHDGGYQINSDNAAVSAFTVYDDEMHIVGRVIWIGRNV